MREDKYSAASIRAGGAHGFPALESLRDRLKAMGMSPKKCFKLLLRAQSDSPARALFPAWRSIERVLTEQLVQAYREDYLAKREMAQIVLGRPIG